MIKDTIAVTGCQADYEAGGIPQLNIFTKPLSILPFIFDKKLNSSFSRVSYKS